MLIRNRFLLAAALIAVWVLSACVGTRTPAGTATEGAPGQVVLTWHREGGLAGFCDDLTVYRDGRAVASSCRGGTGTELGGTTLTAAQQEQLRSWLDTLKPFTWTHTDGAVADSMSLRLILASSGRTEATQADRDAIQAFAAELFAAIQAQG
jgi:hypothetical protein